LTGFWLIGIIVFAVIEGLTVGLTSIWFAIGSVAAMIAAALGAGLPVQVVLFFAVSAVTLLFTRPLAKKYLSPKKTRTNADRVIGKTGIVTETIDNLKATGMVSIGGVLWTARSEGDEIFPVDTRVNVTRIEGVKVFVIRAAAPVEAGV
jgi:membrane protein implicated in regulation of membrane protease activity